MGKSRDDNSFRELFTSMANDSNTRAILIGENHTANCTPEAILANMDVLENLNREVIFVVEDLPQSANKSPHELDAQLQGKDFKLYHLYKTLQSKGIPVLGTENSKSNPFMKVDLSNPTSQEIRDMKAYSGSINRTINANEVFSDVINEQNPNALIVFIGGAAHVPAVTIDGNQVDPGMSGRIPNSRSIYLAVQHDQKPDETIQTDYKYTNSDTKGSGQFQYYVISNDEKMHINTLNSLRTREDKINYFKSVVNDLVESYITYPQSKAFTFKNKFDVAIEAFKKCTGIGNDFQELIVLRDAIAKEKSNTQHNRIAINNAIDKNIPELKVKFSSTAEMSRKLSSSNGNAIATLNENKNKTYPNEKAANARMSIKKSQSVTPSNDKQSTSELEQDGQKTSNNYSSMRGNKI